MLTKLHDHGLHGIFTTSIQTDQLPAICAFTSSSTSDDGREASAPLELWTGGIEQIAQHAEDRQIHAKFPKLAARLFHEAMDTGYAGNQVSALFKALPKPS